MYFELDHRENKKEHRIHVVAPYVTSRVVKGWQAEGVFFATHQTMKTIGESNFTSQELLRLNELLDPRRVETLCLMYFSHKVADGRSILNNVLEHGRQLHDHCPTPSVALPHKGVPFIPTTIPPYRYNIPGALKELIASLKRRTIDGFSLLPLVNKPVDPLQSPSYLLCTPGCNLVIDLPADSTALQEHFPIVIDNEELSSLIDAYNLEIPPNDSNHLTLSCQCSAAVNEAISRYSSITSHDDDEPKVSQLVPQ